MANGNRSDWRLFWMDAATTLFIIAAESKSSTMGNFSWAPGG